MSDPTPQPTDLSFLEAAPQPKRGGFSLGSMVLLAGILIFAGVIGLALLKQRQSQPTSGPAPSFELTTFDGQTLRLEDLRGQIVVLNFWASWCGPCRDEAPALQTAWENYRDKGVIILGVAYADVDSQSLEFIDEYGMTYLNAPDNGTRISSEYHITGVPETFFIDQNGEIVTTRLLPIEAEDLNGILDLMLAEQETDS